MEYLCAAAVVLVTIVSLLKLWRKSRNISPERKHSGVEWERDTQQASAALDVMPIVGAKTQVTEGSLLELKDCKGEISYKGSSLSIEFRLSCSRDGRISIFPQRVPLSDQSKFLL